MRSTSTPATLSWLLFRCSRSSPFSTLGRIRLFPRRGMEQSEPPFRPRGHQRWNGGEDMKLSHVSATLAVVSAGMLSCGGYSGSAGPAVNAPASHLAWPVSAADETAAAAHVG